MCNTLVTSLTFTLSITIAGTHSTAAGAFQSLQLIVLFLSICNLRIFCYIPSRIHFPDLNRLPYILIKSQICVFKTVPCIPLFIFALCTTPRKLPPSQLLKEFCTIVEASRKHCDVSILAKWNLYRHLIK